MPGGGKVDDDGHNDAGVPFMTEELYKANILTVHEIKNEWINQQKPIISYHKCKCKS